MNILTKILSFFRRKQKPKNLDSILMRVDVPRGAYCYELNIDTGQIVIVYPFPTHLGDMVVENDGCIYEVCANRRSAIRKFGRRMKKIVANHKVKTAE